MAIDRANAVAGPFRFNSLKILFLIFSNFELSPPYKKHELARFMENEQDGSPNFNGQIKMLVGPAIHQTKKSCASGRHAAGLAGT